MNLIYIVPVFVFVNKHLFCLRKLEGSLVVITSIISIICTSSFLAEDSVGCTITWSCPISISFNIIYQILISIIKIIQHIFINLSISINLWIYKLSLNINIKYHYMIINTFQYLHIQSHPLMGYTWWHKMSQSPLSIIHKTTWYHIQRFATENQPKITRHLSIPFPDHILSPPLSPLCVSFCISLSHLFVW